MDRQPRGAHGHQLPQGAGQAARGQPQGHQRLPAAAPRQGRSPSPTSSASPSSGPSHDDRAGDERTRSSRTPTASRRSSAQRARQPRHRRRRRQVRRPAARSLVPVIRDADTARLPRLPGRLRGADPQGEVRTSSASTTSRAPRVSPTNPGTIGTVQSRAAADAGPGRDRRRRARSTTRPSARAPTRPRSPTSACRKVVTITLHLRPPHHPGRRVRPVPEAGRRSCCSASDGFYDEVFACLERALRGRRCGGATSTRSTASRRCSRSRWPSPT